MLIIFVNGPYCCLLKSTDLRALADTKLVCGLREVRQILAISHGELLTCRTLTPGISKCCVRDMFKCHTALFALDFNCLFSSLDMDQAS